MASSLTVNQQTPFLFLDFPAEVRNRVYYHALGNSILRADRPCPLQYSFPFQDLGFTPSKSERPYIGLLLTCKQIYDEAYYILHQYGCLQIRVVSPSCKFDGSHLWFHVGSKYEPHLNLVRNLRIEFDRQNRHFADFQSTSSFRLSSDYYIDSLRRHRQSSPSEDRQNKMACCSGETLGAGRYKAKAGVLPFPLAAVC